MFNGRLGLDATWYSARSVDQILPVEVSSTSGYTSRVLNAGIMTNKGIELLASATPVALRNGFSWDVTANFARNRNMVEDLYDDLETLVLGTYWSLQVQARKGHPYGVLWGRQYERDAAGNIVVDPATGVPVNLNTNPQGVLGNYNPDWTGSLTNTLRYRNVDFSFMFDTQQGADVFSVTQMFGMYAGVLRETLEGRCISRTAAGTIVDECSTKGYLWPGVRPDGQPNTTRTSPEPLWQGHFNMHEAFVLDASYVKLREVRIGYDVPARFSQRVGLNDVRLAAVGRNLWLWTDIPHIDPEVAFDASNVQGLEFGSLPSARSFGIHVTVRP
jgi:hypothetical protein